MEQFQNRQYPCDYFIHPERGSLGSHLEPELGGDYRYVSFFC